MDEKTIESTFKILNGEYSRFDAAEDATKSFIDILEKDKNKNKKYKNQISIIKKILENKNNNI